MEAQAEDEDLARAYLDRAGDEQPEAQERMSEWSAEREALARVEDLLGQLIDVTIGVATGHKPNPRPAKRPVTAVQRVRRDRRVIQHRQLAARVLPTDAGPEPDPAPPAP